MYIKRHAEETVRRAANMFSAVMVTGPRQVGKTTLLRNMFGETAGYVSLDDPIDLLTAREETGVFLQQHDTPLIIDEVQYAPALFPYIKMAADKEGKKGLFYLTGSQSFHLMKNVAESMAGRVGILQLLGLSLRELQNVSCALPFLPAEAYLDARAKELQPLDYFELFTHIQRGTMPALSDKNMDWRMYYSSYLMTYIERDVRDLTQVGNINDFIKFMSVAAARTGQLLNYSELAKDVGISAPTAKNWLSVLEASGIVYLLQPYFNNRTKRATKTPKLYFLDTGLAAFLTKWNTPEVLESGAMAGAFFETFALGEILKSYYNAGITHPSFYYYRDKEQREIDLIIEENGKLHPIEIKKTANPSKSDIANFAVLDIAAAAERGSGGIVCMYSSRKKLTEKDYILPISYL